MADELESCCCFLFTRSNHFKRTENRRHAATAASAANANANAAAAHASRLSSNAAREGQTSGEAAFKRRPRGARRRRNSFVKEATNCCLISRRLDCEEIELKCYSLSPDCLLVNSDKRCQLISPANGLTTARPLDDFEDGRRHLDVRRPESMSLVKFKIDPETGAIERRLSIHEIDQDNEFLDCLVARDCGAHDQELALGAQRRLRELSSEQDPRLRLAERLSSRSFLLIERASSKSKADVSDNKEEAQLDGHDDADHCPSEPAETASAASKRNSVRLGESWDALEETQRRPPLEQELISSISIERRPDENCECAPPSPSPPPAPSLETCGSTKRRLKRLRRLNLARRFYKLLISAGASASSPESKYATLAGPPAYDECEPTSGGRSERPDENDDEDDNEDGEDDDFERANTITRISFVEERAGGQLVALARPDSVYLWPERFVEQTDACPGANSSWLRNEARAQLSRRSSMAMISYNHAEAKEYAIALHSQLRQLGVSAYLDLFDIQKGEDWQDSLNFAILNCGVFIPLVTPSYGETLWTSRECKLADVLAKRIIPINFGQNWPPPSLAIQFATLQYIDWLHLDTAHRGEPGEPGEEWARSLDELRHVQARTGALARRPGWPSRCVQSIARQLKTSIQLEFGGQLQASGQESAMLTNAPDLMALPSPNSSHANQAATATTANGAPNLRLQLAKPPSPNSDSGYESPRREPHADNEQTDELLPSDASDTHSILNTSLQSNQSGNSLARKLRHLASMKTSDELQPQRQRQQQHLKQKQRQPSSSSCGADSQSSNEPTTAETISDALDPANGFKLQRTRLEGGELEHSARLDRQPPGTDEPRAQVAANKTKNQRKTLGQRAKKVLGRVRRSLGPAKTA